MQAGHVVTRASGAREVLVLQSAWLNQTDNLTVESARIGGSVQNKVVEIGGIGVEARTAEWLQGEGLLPDGTVIRPLDVSFFFN